jgi:hypothetical protein
VFMLPLFYELFDCILRLKAIVRSWLAHLWNL